MKDGRELSDNLRLTLNKVSVNQIHLDGQYLESAKRCHTCFGVYLDCDFTFYEQK
jgi:hypothetical protein